MQALKVGERGSKSVASAARTLVEKYPERTVRYYDLGDGRIGRSPTDRITADDIGRATVFAARIAADRAAAFLDTPVELELDDELPDLEAAAETPADEWITSEPITAAYRLFRSVNSDSYGYAQSSKLLHLKWPSFFPIVDSRLREVYGCQATCLHNDYRWLLGLGRSLRRWGRVDVRVYWLLFRTDLIANRRSGALADLREAMRTYEDVPESRRDHRDRLAEIDDLRLLDMVAWSLKPDDG